MARAGVAHYAHGSLQSLLRGKVVSLRNPVYRCVVAEELFTPESAVIRAAELDNSFLSGVPCPAVEFVLH